MQGNYHASDWFYVAKDRSPSFGDAPVLNLDSVVRGVMLLGLAGAAACSENVAGLPEQLGNMTQQSVAGVEQPGSNPAYRCDLFLKTASGEFSRRTVLLSFPKPELHETRVTRQYRYHGFAGKEVVRLGLCVIPATDKALRRVDRLFRLTGRPVRPAAAISMDCPKGGCILEEVTVVACQGGGTYPDCNETPVEYQRCDWWNPCGASGPGGSPNMGPGGGGTPPPNPCWDCAADPDAPCSTGDPIIDSPEVNAIFRDLWTRSNYGPNVPHDQRLEQAAWIVQQDGRYSAVAMASTSTPCSVTPAEPPPTGAVGYIHTHPYDWGNVPLCDIYYAGTASSGDVDTMRNYGFAQSYLIDPIGIGRVSTNTVGTTTERKPRCMY